MLIDESDVFETDDIKDEDEKFILHLLQKINFSQDGIIYHNEDNDEKSKSATVKDEQKDIKLDNSLLPKPGILENKVKEKMEQDRIKENIKIKNAFSTENNLRKKFKKERKSGFNKRMQYHKEFVNLNKLENRNDIFKKDAITTKTIFAKQNCQANRSTLYSFGGLFPLLNADIANLKFWGKSAVDPKYCFLFADLFTS